MSSNTDRISEAVQLARELDILLNEINKTESSIEDASTLLEDLNNKRTPDPSKLEQLGLESLKGYALRARLQGLLQVKRGKLSELKIALRRERGDT